MKFTSFSAPARLTARITLIAALMALVGCAAPSASYVVLINNDDGTIGQVTVTGAEGMATLHERHEAAHIQADPGQTFTPSDEKIHNDFVAAITARAEKPKTFLLYFDVGGTKLTAESELKIAQILADVDRRKTADISIIGHTDTAGDSVANERLGLERAQSVGLLLQNPKLNAENVEIVSHGKNNLLIPTPDNTAEARNRRVEVTVR